MILIYRTFLEILRERETQQHELEQTLIQLTTHLPEHETKAIV